MNSKKKRCNPKKKMIFLKNEKELLVVRIQIMQDWLLCKWYQMGREDALQSQKLRPNIQLVDLLQLLTPTIGFPLTL